MKKEKMKELLFWGVIIIIGVGCIFAISVRAEQYNKWEAQQHERINY